MTWRCASRSPPRSRTAWGRAISIRSPAAPVFSWPASSPVTRRRRWPTSWGMRRRPMPVFALHGDAAVSPPTREAPAREEAAASGGAALGTEEIHVAADLAAGHSPRLAVAVCVRQRVAELDREVAQFVAGALQALVVENIGDAARGQREAHGAVARLPRPADRVDLAVVGALVHDVAALLVALDGGAELGLGLHPARSTGGADFGDELALPLDGDAGEIGPAARPIAKGQARADAKARRPDRPARP